MRQGDLYFAEENDTWRVLRLVASRLVEAGTPYAVIGGLALFAHGYRRFTEDIDVVCKASDADSIAESFCEFQLVKAGATRSRLRDNATGVDLDLFFTGAYPGDNEVKPVAFPDPAGVSIDCGGVRFVKLTMLIDLKLASGMSNVSRMKDLADILELIKAAKLPRDLAAQLNPYVRDEYERLWQASQIKSPNDHD